MQTKISAIYLMPRGYDSEAQPKVALFHQYTTDLVGRWSGRKPLCAYQEDVWAWLAAPHFRVVPQHDVMEQAEELLVSARLLFKGRHPRAGGNGTGDVVFPQVLDQFLNT